jgi:D-alanyl-D-alanine carboxypeptidase (penicillin-binding protein 5/6)
VVKLMTLLLTIERVEAGTLGLQEPVRATAEAAGMGGSQIYLSRDEIMTVNDLLYALMLESANDAAVALAVQAAGSTAAFVERMNHRARELGMTRTRYRSVHGLPGAEADVSTPRDIARLGREVVRHPLALGYTGTRVHALRQGRLVMRNHNHLLGEVPGCDGLKTGFFSAAGFSIAATAKRGRHRVVAVVMGSRRAAVRNAAARGLLDRGLTLLASRPPPAPPAPPASAGLAQRPGPGLRPLWGVALVVIGALIVTASSLGLWLDRRRP